MYIMLRGIVSVEAMPNLFVFAYKRRAMHRYTFHVELTRSIPSLEKASRQIRTFFWEVNKDRETSHFRFLGKEICVKIVVCLI